MPTMGTKLLPSLTLTGPLLPQRKGLPGRGFQCQGTAPSPHIFSFFGRIRGDGTAFRAVPRLRGWQYQVHVFLTTSVNFPAGMERPSKCRAKLPTGIQRGNGWRRRKTATAGLPDPKKPHSPPPDLGTRGGGGRPHPL